MLKAMNEDLVAQVEELGLSQKEARVYVASLVLGPATVQRIADFAAIKRVTTYVILESLSNLGLVSQSTKGKKTYFVAEDAGNLSRLLEKKAQALKEQKQSLEEILPQLRSLKSLPSESPSVKFYDSPEGIKSIMTTFLDAHREDSDKLLLGISNLDQLWQFFPEFRTNLTNPERVKHGFRSKIIYTSKEGAVFKGTDPARMRESRFVPPAKFGLNGDISMVGNHIIMLSLTGTRPIGITIDSKQLADGLKAFFELAWQGAEAYN
jgi:HTH-type transcriptional regulator, sugar sensing transcriptional regulator